MQMGLGSSTEEAVSIVRAWCGSPCMCCARAKNSPEVRPSNRTAVFLFPTTVERDQRGICEGFGLPWKVEVGSGIDGSRSGRASSDPSSRRT